jgi:hypothetical protein
MCSGHWSTAMCDHPLQMGQWRFVWTWPVLRCSVDPTQNVGYHLPLKTCDCHRMNSGFASIDYAKTQLFPLYMWTNIHHQSFRCDFTTVRDR